MIAGIAIYAAVTLEWLAGSGLGDPQDKPPQAVRGSSSAVRAASHARRRRSRSVPRRRWPPCRRDRRRARPATRRRGPRGRWRSMSRHPAGSTPTATWITRSSGSPSCASISSTVGPGFAVELGGERFVAERLGAAAEVDPAEVRAPTPGPCEPGLVGEGEVLDPAFRWEPRRHTQGGARPARGVGGAPAPGGQVGRCPCLRTGEAASASARADPGSCGVNRGVK